MASEGWNSIEVMSTAVAAAFGALSTIGAGLLTFKKWATADNAKAIAEVSKQIEAVRKEGNERSRRLNVRLDELPAKFVTKAELEHRDRTVEGAFAEHTAHAESLSASVDGLRSEFHQHTVDTARQLGEISANMKLLLDVRDVQ